VVASIFLALEFIKRVQNSEKFSQKIEESPTSNMRKNAFIKNQFLSAGCPEMPPSLLEKKFDYAKFQEQNYGWWTKHFDIPEKSLNETFEIILTIYE